MRRGQKSLDLGPRTSELGDTPPRPRRLQIVFGEFQSRKGSLSLVHLSTDLEEGSERWGLTQGSQMGRDALE